MPLAPKMKGCRRAATNAPLRGSERKGAELRACKLVSRKGFRYFDFDSLITKRAPRRTRVPNARADNLRADRRGLAPRLGLDPRVIDDRATVIPINRSADTAERSPPLYELQLI